MLGEPDPNLIVRMFRWWNEAYGAGGFTAEGFARFFTEDAPFIVSGVVRGVGPAEISKHFEAIRAETDRVDLVLPVKDALFSDAVGFVHYEVTADRGGISEGEECLAVAHFRDGRISSFRVLSRTTGSPLDSGVP